MNKRLQTFILYVLIVSVINGAFFNRIGSRIAERPYFTLIFNTISSVFFKIQLDDVDALLYSKRTVPNNLPPSHSINFVKDYTSFYNSLFLKHQFADTNIEKSKIVFYFKNAALSDAFKVLLIKPPCCLSSF
ncbi:MAG: hypothetical protein ACEQSR_15885 [Candidatus Methylacidiphilales bacterium]